MQRKITSLEVDKNQWLYQCQHHVQETDSKLSLKAIGLSVDLVKIRTRTIKILPWHKTTMTRSLQLKTVLVCREIFRLEGVQLNRAFNKAQVKLFKYIIIPMSHYQLLSLSIRVERVVRLTGMIQWNNQVRVISSQLKKVVISSLIFMKGALGLKITVSRLTRTTAIITDSSRKRTLSDLSLRLIIIHQQHCINRNFDIRAQNHRILFLEPRCRS